MEGHSEEGAFEPERFALQGTPGVWPDDASTRRSRTRVPGGTETKRTLRQTCPRLQTEGAICVQRLDDSRNSAIHTTYRSLLRSSSTHEPRGPPLEVVSLLRCLLDNKDQPKPMRSTSSSTKKSFKNRGPAASRRGRRRDLSRRLASPSDPRETSPENAAKAGLGLVHRGSREEISPIFNGNDPSAGSPTETLLRLLLPLNDQV